MSSRERVLSALNLEEPDRIPLFELYFDPPIVEKITGVSATGAMYESKRESIKTNSMAMIRCHEMLGMDSIVVWDWMSQARGFEIKIGSDKTYTDEWGIRWRVSPDASGYMRNWWNGPAINSPEDFEKYVPPDPFAPGKMEAAEFIVEKVKKKMFVVGGLRDVFELSWQLRGMENFLLDLYTNPRFAEKIMDVILETNIKMGKALLDAGVDALLTGDDYADSHGPMFPPRIFRKYFLPRLKRFTRALKINDIFMIKHCDGDINPIFEDFIEAGFDAINPLEPPVMNLKETKNTYGDKVCLIGNIDCGPILTHGSEQDVEKAVKESIDNAADGGGYIMSSSNSAHSGIKAENYVTLVKAARQYGIYPVAR